MASLKWTDVYDIGFELLEAHPGVDPLTVRFTQLAEWVRALDDFDDPDGRPNEKILEAIQMAWLEESQE
jgi:FeS assembly protein IscX